jgi:outer membrane lipoprotein carrier protein
MRLKRMSGLSKSRLALAILPSVALIAPMLLAAAPRPSGPPAAARRGLSNEDPPPAVLHPSLNEVLRGVENKYNRLKSMKAHFEQSVRQGGGVQRSERGEIYMSRPGRMRWEYQSPEPKLFLTDGKQVTLYLPSENRVMESAIKESDDIRAPLAFLLGRLNFDEQFEKRETSAELTPVEKGNIVFKCYSKKMAERLEWVLFEVTPSYEIRRVVARENGGVETEFRFNSMEANPSLADSMFRFTAPAGAEIVKE